MAVQLVVASGNRMGHVIPVSTKKFIIGRADDCHMKPRSEMVSRYHCAILVGDDVVVRDLGSKNGVRLNGEKISTEKKLKNGDKLVVGPLEFYVHITATNNEFAEPAAGGGAGTVATWFLPPDGTGDASAQADTILLDRLKALNPESNTESEKPVLEFLKKFT